MKNTEDLNNKIKKILEENVYGLICPCGGGGTDEGNKTCEVCNGTGIYDWRYGAAVDALSDLIDEVIDMYRE